VCDTSFNQRSPRLITKQTSGQARGTSCMKRKILERRYFVAPVGGGEALSRANDAEFSGQPRALLQPHLRKKRDEYHRLWKTLSSRSTAVSRRQPPREHRRTLRYVKNAHSARIRLLADRNRRAEEGGERERERERERRCRKGTECSRETDRWRKRERGGEK